MKSFKLLFLNLLIVFAVFGSTVKCAYAVNIDTQTQSNGSALSTDDIPADNVIKTPAKINLTIQITVPHNRSAIDSCRIFPYPVAPPKKKEDLAPLSIKDKTMRTMLLNMGYFAKTRADKPFPTGGWRMQTALAAAVKNSGIGLPHTIFTEYSWAENMIPYLRKEVKIINAKELARKQRYEQAQTVFNEYRADIEVQSFNQGLYPIDVPIHRALGGYRQGKLVVDKANWWIVAMHKVPGLKYYWLWPVKLGDSPDQLVVLDEDNAILIEGAW